MFSEFLFCFGHCVKTRASLGLPTKPQATYFHVTIVISLFAILYVSYNFICHVCGCFICHHALRLGCVSTRSLSVQPWGSRQVLSSWQLLVLDCHEENYWELAYVLHGPELSLLLGLKSSGQDSDKCLVSWGTPKECLELWLWSPIMMSEHQCCLANLRTVSCILFCPLWVWNAPHCGSVLCPRWLWLGWAGHLCVFFCEHPFNFIADFFFFF